MKNKNMRWLILISCFLGIQQIVLNGQTACDTSAIHITFQDAINQELICIGGTTTIDGTWRLTTATPSFVFTNGSKIIMEPGAQIIVAPRATLILDGTTVTACNRWLLRVHSQARHSSQRRAFFFKGLPINNTTSIPNLKG